MQIHGRKITTVISDLDGTLLDEDSRLDEALFPLIRRLKEQGVSFIAASGRQYKNMRCLFAPIWEDLSFVCENGSIVVKDDKTVYIHYIPRELCFELLGDMFSLPGTETLVSSDGELYALAKRENFARNLSRALMFHVNTVEDYRAVTGGINKISIWFPQGIRAGDEAWLHGRYDDRMHVTDSGNGWLDFMMKGVNKGAALQELSRLEGFPMEEALCFGDSENDIAMFRVCGVSYAMASGKKHVKAAADYVCTDVGEVLRALAV